MASVKSQHRAAGARPLRVAIVSPTFGGYGGLEAFVLTLAREMQPEPDVETRLIFKRTADFVLHRELEAAVALLGDRVQIVDRASRALRMAIGWADVVHAQNASPDVVAWAKLRGRPLLVNVINHRLSCRSLRQWLWAFGLRRADRRFYISDFVRRTWEGAVPWPRSEVVFPICDLASNPLPPADRRGFVFVARWIANKGVETLVEAYARAGLDGDEWPLRLIGDGPMRPVVERRIAALGLRGVEMPGFVSAEAKASAVRSARWIVIPPNTHEDFGLTAIEARHLQVPCIITRDGGLPEAAGDEALTCAPGDVAGLADCLRVAAAMSEAEYWRRCVRTHETLLPRLARGAFYAEAYRALAGRGRS